MTSLSLRYFSSHPQTIYLHLPLSRPFSFSFYPSSPYFYNFFFFFFFSCNSNLCFWWLNLSVFYGTARLLENEFVINHLVEKYLNHCTPIRCSLIKQQAVITTPDFHNFIFFDVVIKLSSNNNPRRLQIQNLADFCWQNQNSSLRSGVAGRHYLSLHLRRASFQRSLIRFCLMEALPTRFFWRDRLWSIWANLIKRNILGRSLVNEVVVATWGEKERRNEKHPKHERLKENRK